MKSNIEAKKKFDVFAAYDDEDQSDDGKEVVSDSDILPEIIKDDSFEGDFDDDQGETQFTSADEPSNSGDDQRINDGNSLGHLKMMSSGSSKKKDIDVRKGI